MASAHGIRGKIEIMRPPVVVGDVAHIVLSNGMTSVIDAVDLDRVGKFNWVAKKIGKQYYASRSRYANNRSYTEALHRVIVEAGPEMMVDHINGNTLDNRRCNLRVASNSQNQANRRAVKGVSPFKGVVFCKQTQKWRAVASKKGRKMSKRFDNEIDAAKAYDEFSVELHGEYAMTNKKLGLLPSEVCHR